MKWKKWFNRFSEISAKIGKNFRKFSAGNFRTHNPSCSYDSDRLWVLCIKGYSWSGCFPDDSWCHEWSEKRIFLLSNPQQILCSSPAAIKKRQKFISCTVIHRNTISRDRASSIAVWDYKAVLTSIEYKLA